MPKYLSISALALTTVAAALAASCGTDQATSAKPNGSQPTAATADTDRLRSASTDLQAMFDQAAAIEREREARAAATVRPAPRPAAVSTPNPDASAPFDDSIPVADVKPTPTAKTIPALPTTVDAKPATTVSLAERRQSLAKDLGLLLRDEAGPSGSRYGLGVRLALLASLVPELASLGAEPTELSADEARSLKALRDGLRPIASPSAAADDPDAVARAVRDLSNQLNDNGVLAIPGAALCERVEGFGRYIPFEKYAFPAGRAQEIIVYAEVEGFAQRRVAADSDPATSKSAGGAAIESFSAELGQEVALFSNADGHTALHRPEQIVRDTSRRPRRDFYLVQRITLPPTLAIGAYNLKITIRDKATGAAAERIVPIEITEVRRR